MQRAACGRVVPGPWRSFPVTIRAVFWSAEIPRMSLSALPLSYCTNVHPGRSLAEVQRGLRDYTSPLRAGYGAPLAAGLWLAAPVIRELGDDPTLLPEFRDALDRLGLTCHTLNAFPFGDFHSPRVKENVYLPDWADRRRLDYTVACARVLAALLPAEVDGSISTCPPSFKEFPNPEGHLGLCIENLIDAAIAFDRLHAETGRMIRLALEPEPLCLVETTDEAIDFFAQLRERARRRNCLDAARRHLGLCFDVCHQAVEFEDVAASVRKLQAADVRINKVHITCALQLDAPATNAQGRQALARYAEERYLHQTFALLAGGDIARRVDLTSDLALDPPAPFRDASLWRIHFHVPVDAEQFGPLSTTRTELRRALEAVAELPYAPHLEVETYTWEVLPERESPGSSAQLIEGLTRELLATRELLQQTANARPPKNRPA